MNLVFVQPIWLLIALIAIPLGFVLVRWCVAMARVRRWSAVATRVVLMSLIAAMLAGASSVRETSKVAVVAVVDVSDSVRRFGWLGLDSEGNRIDVLESVTRSLRSLDAGRGPDDLLGIVVFGGDSAAIATPTRASIVGRDLDVRLAEGTDLAGAIRLAGAMVPPDAAGKLLVVSDGNQTLGDALEATREVTSRSSTGSLGIDVVPIDFRIGDETIVESVIVPTQASAESVVTVRVVISTVNGTTGTLHLTEENNPVDINGSDSGAGRRLELTPGRHAILLDVPLPQGRIHRFRATFEPDMTRTADGPVFAGDTHLDNNQAEAFTISPGSGEVLIVDGVGDGNPSGEGGILGQSLTRSGAEVRFVAPEGVPTDLLGLQPYDLVILQNVPADALSENIQHNLAAHVRDMGGGLIMIGGPASFGSGGWMGSPVEPILPVKLDIGEKLVERRTAIVLVLDSSGSMSASVGGSFKSQQQIANAAAALAVRSLGANDLVGVIRFSNNASWVKELGPNDNPLETASAIESIMPGGGTNIPPGLEMARQALKGVDAAVKHIIVLSDGRSMGSDLLPAMAEQLASEDINVSTISVGDGADTETLFAMADKGGGVHYPVTNPSVLPRVFVRAVRIVRDPLIKEGLFQPVVLPTGSPAVSGLGSMRGLEGLVLTAFRDEALVTNALATPEGEPLLSHWTVGLGRVAAFTSDAHRWAAPWLGWDGYDIFWAQLTQLIARAPAARGVELSTEIDSGRLRVRMLALNSDGNPVEGLAVPATVYTPNGERVELTLDQSGPGQYEAVTDAGASGNYIAIVRPRDGSRALPPVLGGATQSSSAEYASLRGDRQLLQQIAEATGGRVMDLSQLSAENLYQRGAIEPRRAEASLWRTLLLLSVVVMLLDVATRRIAWDRFITEREPRVAIAGKATAGATLSELRKATKAEKAEESEVRLTAADASKVALEARQKRVQARKAAREQGNQSEKPAASTKLTDETKAKKKDESESGLLAAKRRARERFEEDR
ncbi:MAG: VWA domain-containing protein [Phycisphaerales bacterium]|nr:VWA domain-containing protein [Phycisphaerales bacterium]MCB9836597.1 VWA domain-containing protein [Phycisphaera sp.]